MSVQPFERPQPAPIRHTPWAEYLDAALVPDWRSTEWDADRSLFTGDPRNPATSISQCLTPACGTLIGAAHGRCQACRRALLRAPSAEEFDRSYRPTWRHGEGTTAGAAAHQFSLGHLGALTRAELLYGLQRRDAEGLAVHPSVVHRLAAKIGPTSPSMLDSDPQDLTQIQLGLFRSLRLHLQRLRTAHRGEDGTSGEVWDCALVGLRSAPNRPYLAVTGQLDFRGIRQQWLRELVLQTTRARRPSVTEARRDIQAAEIASLTLAGRPHGNDPSRLSLADMTVVFQAFRQARNTQDQTLYSVTHRRALLGRWRGLLTFARAACLMDEIPGSFALTADHAIPDEDRNEDELGEAIPEPWIAHLDAHLHLLGTTSSYSTGGWSAQDFAEMYRTVYQLVRDTGRRPNEIVSLGAEPLDYPDGEPSLIYDNHKSRRKARRLPVENSTRHAIQQWQKRLETLPVPKECRGYLFPAPGGRNRPRRGHLAAAQFGKMFAAWVALVPDPERLPQQAAGFSRGKLEPYGLRHAYAQRHADAGVSVDVLRELMDHKDVNTTMGYYRVSLKRKRQAVSVVAQHAVDRHGNPAPFSDELAYQRSSVAVPYGNCTEPSNVKAGGNDCPIRFQCAGCGFFRPDPSYLGPIDQHIEQLHADRAMATAAAAAGWVVQNLDEQIAAFTEVSAKMRHNLEQLPEPERQAIETSCQELRKARQATVIPVEQLLRKPT
ncbi:site-specific integrase [Citricoccus nitrophenolicus]